MYVPPTLMRCGTGPGYEGKRCYGKVPRAIFYNYPHVIEELIIMISLYMLMGSWGVSACTFSLFESPNVRLAKCGYLGEISL